MGFLEVLGLVNRGGKEEGQAPPPKKRFTGNKYSGGQCSITNSPQRFLPSISPEDFTTKSINCSLGKIFEVAVGLKNTNE